MTTMASSRPEFPAVSSSLKLWNRSDLFLQLWPVCLGRGEIDVDFDCTWLNTASDKFSFIFQTSTLKPDSKYLEAQNCHDTKDDSSMGSVIVRGIVLANLMLEARGGCQEPKMQRS
jgi:hypothetical protein